MRIKISCFNAKPEESYSRATLEHTRSMHGANKRTVVDKSGTFGHRFCSVFVDVFSDAAATEDVKQICV